MAKNDLVVRTAKDLERKYNFAFLLGLKKNVEITTQGIQKIENELNSMLNALTINLKDVLDSQSEVSLWFFNAKPNTSNEPYTSWENPNDHIGDIYYDQSSGYVYQWNGVWEVNPSPDLIEAMAITNAELDTTDHERKVFFDTPTIPYSNGDWWIKEDGDLFICQISKTSGTYEENDFINSDNYTESFAEKIGEEIKVLKGTITIISENYAKFTDLATGGSTTISGDNITTGVIKSNGYLAGQKGMAIDLDNGTIDSPNMELDESGNLNIGGYISTDKGLLTNLSFPCNFGETDLGWYSEDGSTFIKHGLQILYNIPSNFTITNAYVTLTHIPCENSITTNSNTSTYIGYARNVNLYQVSDFSGLKYARYGFNGDPNYSSLSKTQVASFSDINSTKPSIITTSDIKDKLTKGSTNMLLIDTSDSSVSSLADALQQTARANAILTVIGYMSN